MLKHIENMNKLLMLFIRESLIDNTHPVLERHSRGRFETGRLPAVQEFGICVSHWRRRRTTTEIPPGREEPGISPPLPTQLTGREICSITIHTACSHTLQIRRDSVNLSYRTKSTNAATLKPHEHQQPPPLLPSHMLNANMQPTTLRSHWPLDPGGVRRKRAAIQSDFSLH